MQSQSNVGWIQFNNMSVQCIARSGISHNWQIWRWRQLKTYLNGIPREPNYLGLHLARGCHISQETRVISLASTLNYYPELEVIVAKSIRVMCQERHLMHQTLEPWHLWSEPVCIEQSNTKSIRSRVNDMQKISAFSMKHGWTCGAKSEL